MTLNHHTTTLLAVALTALLASGAALADNPSGSVSGNANASTQLVSRYSTLAGSDSNARALIDGLRNGTQITLGATSGDTTFTPATSALGYGEVNTSLALARAELSAAGITKPTADQLEVALNGGTVTLADGSTTDLQGVLDLRASGEGWGQVARDLGLNLGAVVSASHTVNGQAGLHGSADAQANASADASTHGDATHGLTGTARAQANIDAHDAAGAHPDVSNLPGAMPSRPELPQRPSIPQRPDIPDHPSGPGH